MWCALEGQSNEANANAADLFHHIRGQQWPRPFGSGRVEGHVRGEILKGCAAEQRAIQASPFRVTPAVLYPEELAPSIVEFVVAHARDIDTHGVERFDRRLIVKHSREQGRRADQIAGRHDEGIRVARGQRRKMGREVLGAAGIDIGQPAVRSCRRLQVAVEVVEGEQLDSDSIDCGLARRQCQVDRNTT